MAPPDVEQLLAEDDFTVFVPNTLDLVEKAGADPEEARLIGGWCSTEDLDRQNEVVVAKGLDFSDFVNWGYFNDNHKQDTAAILGYPRTAVLKGNRWWTEGSLLKGYPPADRVWELAKSLAKSDAPRKLGFSIEGKVVERDGKNRILRAQVRNVAITNCPVNTACTWDILAKAFGEQGDISAAAEKALVAGYQNPATSGGAALRAQSLEGATRQDELSFGDAVERIKRIRPHLSEAACKRIARFAMCR